jgi:type II secretory pathway component GspD/PulD (secretin)
VLFALALAGASGCHTPEAKQPEAAAEEKPGGELTVKKFQELISQGALKPVEAMEPDPFEQVKPDMDDDLFAKAVERIEKGLPPAPEKPAPGPAPAAAEPQQFPENPYLVFGKRIQVYPESGLIMKPYPLRVGTGKKLFDLLTTYGNFPLYDPKSGAQKPDTVRLDLQEKWDMEPFVADLRVPVPVPDAPGTADKSVNMADWLIVTAGFEHLKDVQGFLDIFAAGVPQIEIEAKIVEVSTTDSLDYGVRPVDLTTPIFGFPDNTFVNSFTFNLPNSANFSTGDALLQLGAVQNGMAFNAVLEALATYQNVSINSRPKIAVREGARAEIINTLQIPYYTVNSIAVNGQVAANLAMVEVGVKLYVIPRVVGTRTVALNIDVEASQEAGNATTFSLQNGQTISNPIIAKRGAKTVVYLEPGQAVILGGLIAERTVEDIQKVPLLGDIPLLGPLLFRSTFKKKELTNVLFFIRPRILQGSDLHTEF